jgi:adenylate cyclase
VAAAPATELEYGLRLNEQRFALSVFTLFALVFLIDVTWFGVLRSYDHGLSDSLLRYASRSHPPDPDIVMVVADNRSIDILGEEVDRWPWPREVFGEVARAIAAQNPAAIVFDMVFADPDRSRPQSDAAMSQMIAGLPNVYIAMLRNDPVGDQYGVSLRALAPYAGVDPGSRPDAKADMLLPRALRRDAWRLAAINFLGDSDGVGRRYPIVLDVNGWPLPSMGARVARDLGYKVPDRSDIVLAWPATSHKIVPFVDVYDDVRRIAKGEKPVRPPSEFTGKIVMIGANATGIPDIHPTPRNKTHFGLDIIATGLDNLKHQNYLDTAPRPVTAGIGLALLMLVGAGYWTRRNSVKVVGALLVIASVAILGIAYLALDRRYVLHVATPLWYAWTFYAFMALKTYLGERDMRQRATQVFSRFVNPVVVSQLLSEGGFSREPAARDITVMFCDIRGFTSLSEWMEPKALIGLLNRHFAAHVDVIFRHGGTLDKFIGDAMMAIWGAPIDDPRHAEHAVACALEMRDTFEAFRRDLPPELAGFDIGIGMHSGTAIVGLIGPDSRPEYTAVGDTVNVASRIEGLTSALAQRAHDVTCSAAGATEPLHCRILVSEETRRRAEAAFDFLPAGHYKVKGRTTEVDVFEPRRKKP